MKKKMDDFYINEYYNFLRESERDPEKQILGNYTSLHPWNEECREIVIKWMAEVVRWFDMSDWVLFVGVNYLDRFLSIRRCPRDALQLLAVTTLYVASKMEVIYPPSISEFSGMVDGATPRYIAQLEMKLMTGIKFRLKCTTTMDFISVFVHVDKKCSLFPDILKHALLLARLTLIIPEFADKLPSIITCACWALARRTCGLKKWTKRLQNFTGIEETTFAGYIDPLDALHFACLNDEKPPAIFSMPVKI